MNEVLNTEGNGSPQPTVANQIPKQSDSGSITSLLLYTIVALSLAFFIRFFIAAPYVVSGASMVPAFFDYHYLIIDRVTYDFSPPHRGDVIVFDLPQDTTRALIKRVIGLPGETVIIAGNDVKIVNEANPDGFVLSEPYLDPNNLGGPSNMSVKLAPGQYFVLGDNRKVSADSRTWGILPEEDIVGRAVLRLFPFNMIGALPGQARYEQDSSITNDNS